MPSALDTAAMPPALHLSFSLQRAVLALGAEMKTTVCCARDSTAWLSEPLPDLADAESFAQFEALLASMPGQCGVEPVVLACDCHPAYLSTKYAARGDVAPNLPRVHVQHHEAHVAASAAAQGITDDVIGLAFDGTGYGTDGTLWGGEIFTGNIMAGFTRVGRMRPLTLAGGAAAIREPWRLATALVHDACEAPEQAYPRPAGVPAETWHVVRHMLAARTSGLIISSSLGRLFDGIAALLGICPFAAQEAEAAIALEKTAGGQRTDARYDMPWVTAGDGMQECDWRPMVRAIVADMKNGEPIERIAAGFHDSVVAAVCALCGKLPQPQSRTVVGGGGVFWNTRVREGLRAALPGAGLQLVTPARLPPSDAGISLGQAVLAGNCPLPIT